MFVNRYSCRWLIPIWLAIFSIASCCASELSFQNHSEDSLKLKHESDAVAEDVKKDVTSNQIYDQLVVEQSKHQTKQSVVEATDVLQALGITDDNIISNCSQLLSDAVVEHADLGDVSSNMRLEVETSIIGTTEQSRHTDTNNEPRVASDNLIVTRNAVESDYSVTVDVSNPTNSTSSSSGDHTMNNDTDINIDIDVEINTLNNLDASSTCNLSSNLEDYVQNTQIRTSVDSLRVEVTMKNDDNGKDNNNDNKNNNKNNNNIINDKLISNNSYKDNDNSNSSDDGDTISVRASTLSDDVNNIPNIADHNQGHFLDNHQSVTDDIHRNERIAVTADDNNNFDVDVDVDVKDDRVKRFQSVDIDQSNSSHGADDDLRDSENNNNGNDSNDSNDNDDLSNDKNNDSQNNNGNNGNNGNSNDNNNKNNNIDNNDNNNINNKKDNIGENNNTVTNSLKSHSYTNTGIETKTSKDKNEYKDLTLTTLSASLDSRIKRLSILMVERKDLVDDYNIHQMGKETLMNAVNRHIMKALQHRPLLPLSDSHCTWNYWKERYVCVCVSVGVVVYVCICGCVYMLHVRTYKKV